MRTHSHNHTWTHAHTQFNRMLFNKLFTLKGLNSSLMHTYLTHDLLSGFNGIRRTRRWVSFLREWLPPTWFLWHLTSFHHRRNNCSSFLRHQAHSMNLSSLQIWRGKLLICGQADARLLPPESAPSHLPPLHQTSQGSCQLLGCCLLVPQHPVQAQLHLFLLQLLLCPGSQRGTGNVGPLRRRVEWGKGNTWEGSPTTPVANVGSPKPRTLGTVVMAVPPSAHVPQMANPWTIGWQNKEQQHKLNFESVGPGQGVVYIVYSVKFPVCIQFFLKYVFIFNTCLFYIMLHTHRLHICVCSCVGWCVLNTCSLYILCSFRILVHFTSCVPIQFCFIYILCSNTMLVHFTSCVVPIQYWFIYILCSNTILVHFTTCVVPIQCLFILHIVLFIYNTCSFYILCCSNTILVHFTSCVVPIKYLFILHLVFLYIKSDHTNIQDSGHH